MAGTHLPTPEGWKAEWTLMRSSRGRDSNLQPPDCKSNVVVKTFFRSRDQDRDLDKMNSSALESRDHGLEITSLDCNW